MHFERREHREPPSRVVVEQGSCAQRRACRRRQRARTSLAGATFGAARPIPNYSAAFERFLALARWRPCRARCSEKHGRGSGQQRRASSESHWEAEPNPSGATSEGDVRPDPAVYAGDTRGLPVVSDLERGGASGRADANVTGSGSCGPRYRDTYHRQRDGSPRDPGSIEPSAFVLSDSIRRHARICNHDFSSAERPRSRGQAVCIPRPRSGANDRIPGRYSPRSCSPDATRERHTGSDPIPCWFRRAARANRRS